MMWLLASLALTCFQENEEECKRAMETFQAAYKNAGEAARISAVDGLSKHPCEKAIGTMSQILAGEAEKVRVAAAKVLGGLDHPKAVEAAANAVSLNLKNHEVLEALVKAIGELDWEVGATILNPLLRKHDDKDVLEALHIIIPTLGKLGSERSVEPLIALLKHAENESRGTRRLKGNQRLAALEGPIGKALEEITGGVESSRKKWEEWWKANRDRLIASSSAVYRCGITGKRWTQKSGESVKCPYHDKSEKGAVPVKVLLHVVRK